MNARGTAVMGRVQAEMLVANNQDVQMAQGGAISAEQIRQTRIEATVDTGATSLVLPTAVAKQLGLKQVGKCKVRFADRRAAERTVVEEVRVELLGRHGTFKAMLEPKRTTALIGAIVLEDLDLLVDCRTQKLRPRDPKQIIVEIE